MGLRKHENPIPGAKPLHCKQPLENGNKCNAPATDWIVGVAKIMGSDINFRTPVCAKHSERIMPDAPG